MLTFGNSSLIPSQLLNISVYDTLQPVSTGDPQRIGHHDLIKSYGGAPDWEQKLSSEIQKQKGRMLIAGKHFSHDITLEPGG